jgi:predicted ATP-grasp superfamily ATP-dependent carboligase
LYAKTNLIASDLSDYDFVRDAPYPGFKINKDDPICSIISSSTDREKCLENLELLAENIYNKKIDGGHYNSI